MEAIDKTKNFLSNIDGAFDWRVFEYYWHRYDSNKGATVISVDEE